MDGCDLFCILLIIGVVISVVWWIYSSAEESYKKTQEEKAEKERQRNLAISKCRGVINSSNKTFANIIASFFESYYDPEKQGSGYINPDRIYSNGYKDVYMNLERVIYDVGQNNEELKRLTNGEEEKDNAVPSLREKLEGFKQFGERVEKTSFQTMIDVDNYGRINSDYWKEVNDIDIKDVDIIIDNYEEWLKGDVDHLADIDPLFILKSIWCYATAKPYSSSKFERSKKMLFGLHNKSNKYLLSDFKVAEFYAIKQMGGDDVLRERVRELIKGNRFDSDNLTLIASGLMWMNAYQEENIILQHLLSTNAHMSAKAQERLHSLSNGGGKAPSGFNVVSNENSFYFDVSSLAWKEEEYSGLFENLAFQDRDLTYALAVRDEDKELFAQQGLHVPSLDIIQEKLKETFSEEYGEGVSAEIKRFIALSGGGEEIINGLLINTREAPQMGIITHVARIGKKLNIKFYTLFIPHAGTINEYKQQVLSLHKKLSPSVTMWESSIKDTVLMAIQQLLNASPQEVTNHTDDTDDIHYF